ncbi:hypothetical protein LCGC14_1706690, partial [marine sediment metagenome]
MQTTNIRMHSKSLRSWRYKK